MFLMREFKPRNKYAKYKFYCTTTEPIGKIPVNSVVTLSLCSLEEELSINYNEITIALPFDRLIGFKLENEVTLAKSGGTIGRAIVGGVLAGGAGAVVGGMSGKGKTKSKWIGILMYKNKDGENRELSFIQTGYTGKTKHYGGEQFENKVNEIAADQAEDITEL